MHYTTLGPGDPATWGAYSGHANDPRFDDTDMISESDAHDIATDEILAVPSTISTILRDESCHAHGIIDTSCIQIEDIVDSDIPELLVLLINGTAEQAMEARFRLRIRILADQADDIKRRITELMQQPECDDRDDPAHA